MAKQHILLKREPPFKRNLTLLKKELDLLLPGPNAISIFEKPLSLIGTVSHQKSGEEWPTFEGKPGMPLMQISTDLPLFQNLFGPEIQLITIYCLQDAIYLENEDRWAVTIKEYESSENMVKMTLPKGVPHEKMIHNIKWKKIIDYPLLIFLIYFTLQNL